MKWLFAVLCSAGIILWVVSHTTPENLQQHTTEIPSDIQVPSETPVPTLADTERFTRISVVHAGQDYVIYTYEIPRNVHMQLISNFEEKENGELLSQRNTCEAAINGGFYQQDNTPLGLFEVGGRKLGERIESNLVTGFFWENSEGDRFISNDVPDEPTAFILQTGPYMTVGNNRLKLTSDEQARRSLLGVDKENNLYMLSIVHKENTFSGPYLADVPQIFFQKSVQQKIPFVYLLNLDGGSASFFYAPAGNRNMSLNELTAIGSLLCLKK